MDNDDLRTLVTILLAALVLLGGGAWAYRVGRDREIACLLSSYAACQGAERGQAACDVEAQRLCSVDRIR